MDEGGEGSVKSLCAHGGFELAMQWKAGFLIKAAISSEMGASTKVSYDGSSTEITLAPEGDKKNSYSSRFTTLKK